LRWKLAGAQAQAETLASLPSDMDIRNMLITRVDVQHRGTGAVIVIVAPKGRRTIAYGTLATNATHRINGNTVFNIASITKVFTSLLLSDVVRRGELALDDPASKYLSGQARSIPARDTSRLRSQISPPIHRAYH
jgi:CubicO group peptidase (beta-lactamase class C family)